MEKNLVGCPDGTVEKIWQLYEFTISLIEADCEILEQPVCETAVARACILVLWNFIEEAQDFASACE